jgi:hypothetical protein
MEMPPRLRSISLIVYGSLDNAGSMRSIYLGKLLWNYVEIGKVAQVFPS